MDNNNLVTVEKVSFPNSIIPKSKVNIAGNLFLPAGFETGKKYPAIVVGHPAGGVKEQPPVYMHVNLQSLATLR